MLICNKCGATIENDELKMNTQCHGHSSLGQPFNERISECCDCGGDFEEAKKCVVCGTHFLDEVGHGVCPECIAENTSLENVIKMGDDYCDTVVINGFFAVALSEEKIGEILLDYIKQNFNDNSPIVHKYLEANNFEFADWLSTNK